jgi:DNA adenine methylase
MTRPIFNRFGSKYTKRNTIIPLIPEHTIYVEPFVGGGSIFINKNKAQINVLNDLDKVLIEHYKLLEHCSPNPDDYEDVKTIEESRKYIFEREHKTNEEKMILYKLRISNGFQGNLIDRPIQIYKENNPKTRLKDMTIYQEKFKDVIFRNQDYREIIREFDSVDTFFFLDPPYEKSKDKKHNYAKGSSKFDYEEFKTILSGIKGKFLFTINDSPYIRELFKDFQMIENVCYSNGHKNIFRHELIIMNY